MISLFESLIAALRLIKKTWVSRCLIRADTEVAKVLYFFTWEGTIRIEDETCDPLPPLATSGALLIPPIQPFIVHVDCFLLYRIADAQAWID